MVPPRRRPPSIAHAGPYRSSGGPRAMPTPLSASRRGPASAAARRRSPASSARFLRRTARDADASVGEPAWSRLGAPRLRSPAGSCRSSGGPRASPRPLSARGRGPASAPLAFDRRPVLAGHQADRARRRRFCRRAGVVPPRRRSLSITGRPCRSSGGPRAAPTLLSASQREPPAQRACSRVSPVPSSIVGMSRQAYAAGASLSRTTSCPSPRPRPA